LDFTLHFSILKHLYLFKIQGRLLTVFNNLLKLHFLYNGMLFALTYSLRLLKVGIKPYIIPGRKSSLDIVQSLLLC
jgi:hypothetical protein